MLYRLSIVVYLLLQINIRTFDVYNIFYYVVIFLIVSPCSMSSICSNSVLPSSNFNILYFVIHDYLIPIMYY